MFSTTIPNRVKLTRAESRGKPILLKGKKRGPDGKMRRISSMLVALENTDV